VRGVLADYRRGLSVRSIGVSETTEEHQSFIEKEKNNFMIQSKQFTLMDSVKAWTAGTNVLQSWLIHRNMI